MKPALLALILAAGSLLRGDARFDRHRHRHRCASLLSPASSAGRRLPDPALPRSRVHLGRGLLVPCGLALPLAWRLLGPPALPRQLLGGPPLLQTSVLPRLLGARRAERVPPRAPWMGLGRRPLGLSRPRL
jgi:hypothetical protein